MEKYGKLIEPNTLRFERLLPGPIENVWEYLVDPEKRGLWFCGGSTDLKSGGEMEFEFHNSKLGKTPEQTPDKYKEYGDGFTSMATIVSVEEPRFLSFNWEGGLVTFELTEQDDMVKFILTHEKLQDSKEYKVGTFAGWHTHLDILVDQLTDHDPKGFWGVHMKLEEEYERLI